MRNLSIFLLAMLFLACTKKVEPTPVVKTCQELGNCPPIVDISTPIDPGIGDSRKGEMRNITSKELVAEMGPGWNLGNSFDTRALDKTAWGNPLPTPEMIAAIKAQGFGVLRIPITWLYHIQSSAPYKVDVNYLDRVQKIVNAAIDQGMHVSINVHHDEEWLFPSDFNFPESEKRYKALWEQVARRFKEYGDKLMFETLNEARRVGSANEWSGGTSSERDQINKYHQIAVDAIRKSGGNNDKRHLLISSYAASTTQAAIDQLKVPNDDPRVIISLHTYFPWSFAGQPIAEGGTARWGSDSEKNGLKNELARIHAKWGIERGRAIMLTEFGAINKSNLEDRVNYVQFYTSEAFKLGMKTVIWDDGGNFGLFNRKNLTWNFPTIANVAVNPKN